MSPFNQKKIAISLGTRRASISGSFLSQQFQMTNIAGCRFWVKGNTGVTSDGYYVEAWQDQSGQGNHLTASTDSRRPILIQGDNNISNATTLHFSGAVSFLENNSLSGFDTQSGTTHVFIGYMREILDNQIFYSMGSTAGGDPWPGVNLRTATPNDRVEGIFNDGAASKVYEHNNDYVVDTPFIVLWQMQAISGSTPRLLINGLDDVTKDTDSSLATINISGSLKLGGRVDRYTDGLNMRVTEVAAFNNYVGDPDINDILLYVSSTYAISVSYV